MQFKIKPKLHYAEDDCPLKAPDGFPKDDELHFEIEMLDFYKVKVSILMSITDCLRYLQASRPFIQCEGLLNSNLLWLATRVGCYLIYLYYFPFLAWFSFVDQVVSEDLGIVKKVFHVHLTFLSTLSCRWYHSNIACDAVLKSYLYQAPPSSCLIYWEQ